MDNKKKFFIGLGVMFIVYVSVVGLNLKHSDKSETASENKAKTTIENKNGWLYDMSSGFKNFFIFLLPEIDLFDKEEVFFVAKAFVKSNEVNPCEIDYKNLWLKITENKKCMLTINKADSSSRQLTLIYKRVKNNEATRGINKFNNKLLLANSKVIKPQLKIDRSKLIKPVLTPGHSENNISNPLSLTFIKFDGKSVDKEKKVIKENEKVQLMIPQKGAELILECSICQDYDLLITQNDDQ
ncbi:MAG: hypothetical protein OQL19_01510 [Gammaproteobacteria bacterium]|nr:hypothetical protein [Gammaproteobacteria bacterium]